VPDVAVGPRHRDALGDVPVAEALVAGADEAQRLAKAGAVRQTERDAHFVVAAAAVVVAARLATVGRCVVVVVVVVVG
jgi:hypothetical protein